MEIIWRIFVFIAILNYGDCNKLILSLIVSLFLIPLMTGGG